MTTPISNPLNVLTSLNSGTPSAKQSGSSSDMQFNQLLSRGIEERSQAAPREAEPAKPAEKENAPAKQSAKANQSSSSSSPEKTNKTGSDAANKTASADEQANAAHAEEPTAATEAPGKASAGGDEASEDDQAALAASSDELLALVADMMQAALPPSSTQAVNASQAVATQTTVDADNAAALGSETDPALAFGNGKPETDHATLDLLRKGAAIASNASEEPGAQTGFDASLTQAKDGKGLAEATQTAQRSIPSELAPTAPSGAEARTPTAPVDAQPASVPVAPMTIQQQSQVALQQAQAVAASASDRIAPRVGNPGWDQAVGQKVVWMVAGEQQSASLTLNPPDLGPLQVVVNVSNSQASVNFTSAQPEVRQALENAVPKLREMLGDAGIQLGQANVGAGTPNNQQSGFDGHRQASRSTGPVLDDSAAEPVPTVRTQAITGGGNGLVDTFA